MCICMTYANKTLEISAVKAPFPQVSSVPNCDSQFGELSTLVIYGGKLNSCKCKESDGEGNGRCQYYHWYKRISLLFSCLRSFQGK